MLIGYCRVSTNDQNLDSQIDELKKAGCEKIFKDIISGSKAERVGLTEMLDFVRRGDVVVVYRLDRLGRSLTDLIILVNKLNEKKINLKSLSENIDTTTSGGTLIFHIFGAVAEFEKNIIRERTRSGLNSARARGRRGGRPSLMTEDKIKMAKLLHKDNDIDTDTIVKQLEVSKSTYFRMLRK